MQSTFISMDIINSEIILYCKGNGDLKNILKMNIPFEITRIIFKTIFKQLLFDIFDVEQF